jgi:hypothetical protein
VHPGGVGAGLDTQPGGAQVAGLAGLAVMEPGGDPGALREQVPAAPGQAGDLGDSRGAPGPV